LERIVESTHLPRSWTAPEPANKTDAAHGKSGAPGFFKSDSLLQGNKSVAIEHNGAVYRLQATKLGKLILTK
jgi:hemin uptake protein HemP